MTVDTNMAGLAGDAPAKARQRTQRSLPEKILVAFHHACDSGDYEAAERLLKTANLSLAGQTAIAPARMRRAKDGVVAAHERLWILTRA